MGFLIDCVLQETGFVFQSRLSPGKTADPINLPIENPVASADNEQNLIISSPSWNDPLSSADSNRDDEELHSQNYFDIGVYSGLQWPHEDSAADTLGFATGWEEEIVYWDHEESAADTLGFASGWEADTPGSATGWEEEIVYWDFCVTEISQQNVDNFEEEEEVMIKSMYVDEGKWIKHYSSRHRILLVGEGDFSFSASLAIAFGDASNMIATSLDSKAFLKENYGDAQDNIVELRKRSCKVLHGIDATKMANHALLGHLKFDRIIFNFPFAGFFKSSSRDTQLILHQNLVRQFLKNAKEMMSENGEIHITHKTNGFHIEWNLESLASRCGLYLIEAIKFNHRDYSGYRTKRGFGGDNNFNCNPSKTYKFGRKTHQVWIWE